MIKIGKSYVVNEKTECRLCADITVDERKFTLWFSIDISQQGYLCRESADAFVMAVLPMAMREEHEVVCEDPISSRLRYQLEDYFMPALVFTNKSMNMVRINADLRTEPYKNCGAVGTAFSNDMNSVFTVNQHEKNCEYPLTHIIVFNAGSSVCGEGRCDDEFYKRCQYASRFAKEKGLQTVFVNTNFGEVFHNKYVEVSTFYNISCALALQCLFSVYLLSAEYEAMGFKLEKEEAARYDLLTVGCVSTESLSFYLSGAEVKDEEKICRVSEWNLTECEMDSATKKRIRKRGRVLPANRKKEGVRVEKGGLIRIGKPYIEEMVEAVRLCADVEFQGQKYIMWFSVQKKYGEYLTEDRVDAFVVVFLTTAMRDASDIVCDAPMTRRLLYQINHYLIPMMASNMDEYHFIKVYAEPTDEILECAGAVATGWTGGVDSMFTYMQNLHKAGSGHKLTHLLIANNGAIEGDTRDTFRRMVEKTEKGFAAETGLAVIGVDTNIQEILDENFLAVTDIRHAAVIIALQKLFHVFLESSAYSFSEFSFIAENIAYYEMVLLNYFETDNTVFYSSGGSFSRVQKLKKMSSFSLAQRYLHPCIYALKDNCCLCEKCIRTETALYGLGVLEQFAEVFNVEQFEQDKDWYFARVLMKKELTDYRDALKLLEQKGVDLSGAWRLANTWRRNKYLNLKNILYRIVGKFLK